MKECPFLRLDECFSQRITDLAGVASVWLHTGLAAQACSIPPILVQPDCSLVLCAYLTTAFPRLGGPPSLWS
jgi:hypothetical protein